jgi:DnaJ like chaperone protein
MPGGLAKDDVFWNEYGKRQMGIIGKIVGGTIGFALGGPLGAVAGAVFGHAFDSDNMSIEANPVPKPSMLEETQLAFFVGTFSMLAKLAKADGRVGQEEIDTIEAFATNDLGLAPSSREVAFNIFRAALNSPASFEDFAIQFYGHFRNQPQMIEMMIDILLRVAVADGSIHLAEETLILSAARIFRFDENRLNQLKSRYMASSDKYYDVLGCSRQDSDETIKRRYRHLVQTYHPDKIAGKGLPDEFTQLAQDKFREIQEAYETIKKERNLN